MNCLHVAVLGIVAHQGTGNSRNQDGYREKYILVVAIYDTFISQHISSTDFRGRYLGE